MVLRATDILNRLNEHLTHPVIFAEQAGPKPPYPYISIKETISFIPAAGHPFLTDEDLIDDIKRIATSQPKMSLSITAFGKEFSDVSMLILQTHDWFTFDGYRELKELGYVVADVHSVMSRDSLIVDDYERRQGFDVSLRFVHRQNRIIEEIKVVKGLVNHDHFISKRSDFD